VPDLFSRIFVYCFLGIKASAIACCLMLLGWQLPVVAQQNTPQTSSQPVSQVDLDTGFALAKSKTCLGCHQIDAKRVGPAFQQIAQRHADTQGNLDYLASAIRQGGRGRWGAVPMPAQTQVSESESRLLAQWILSLKP
jgi:cytochrome c